MSIANPSDTRPATRHANPTGAGPVASGRYNTLSRVFHWTMATLFVVVFSAAIVHALAEDSPLDEWLWPVHRPVGALLLVLVVLRAAWSLATARRRPPSVSRAAHFGHLGLYALMIAIPSIGLIRQYGSGRAFEPFGIPVFAARPDDKIEWMQQLGSTFHGELGWLFLATIVGHVAMVIWHRRRGPDVLPRMAG